MTAKSDFYETVELLGKHVSEHVRIVEPSFFKVPLLFRIDGHVPKAFIPRMPQSANSSENSTVPRIVTASTLLGCMCGHSGVVWLATTREAGHHAGNHFEISAFSFSYALLPDKTLVFDAEDTQEAWFVTYDKSTIDYRPIPYGEMFVHKVEIIVQANSKVNKTIANVLVKVDDSRGLPLAGNHVLEKGHYYLKIDVTNYAIDEKKSGMKRMSFKDSNKIDITPISTTVYQSFRTVSVAK